MPAIREIFAEYDVVFDKDKNLEKGEKAVDGTRDKLGRFVTQTTRTDRALDRLSASTGISTKSFKKMGRTLRRMRDPLVKATTAITGMATAAGVAAAAGLRQIVTSTVESTREIDRWAGRLSISSDALRSWIALGSEYGASVDDVTDALKELQLKGQDALTGGTEQAEMFERIGISLDDLRPVINDTDALMAMFTTRLSQVNDVALRNFTVDELMSDAGTRLNEVFALGNDEIQRRRGALTRAIGPTANLSRIVLEHAARVRAVTRRWERFKREITARVLPALGKIAEKVAAFEEPARRMIQKIAEIIQETNILKGVLIGVGIVAVVVAALTIASWGPVVLAFTAVTLVVAGVAAAYDQVTRSLEGSDTALKTFLKDHLGISNDEIQGAVLLLRDAWKDTKNAIGEAGEALDGFLADIEPLITVLEGVWWFLQAISGQGIRDALGGPLITMESLRGAARERAAEEEVRQEPIEARATRNAQAAKGETTDTWTGQQVDEAGFPMSAPARAPVPVTARSREIPTIPRSAAISETRIPRSESSSQQTVAVDAPMTLNFDISEATDIQGIERIVTRGVSEGISHWTSELESLISDQTAVGS